MTPAQASARPHTSNGACSTAHTRASPCHKLPQPPNVTVSQRHPPSRPPAPLAAAALHESVSAACLPQHPPRRRCPFACAWCPWRGSFQEDGFETSQSSFQKRCFPFIVMNTEQVAELLGRLLVPDTAVIKQAEAQLGQLCKEPVSIVRLLEVATLCPNADIRLYALVVLKKRISSLWNKLQPSDRDVVQQVQQTLSSNSSHLQTRNHILRSACPSSCFRSKFPSSAQHSRAS